MCLILIHLPELTSVCKNMWPYADACFGALLEVVATALQSQYCYKARQVRERIPSPKPCIQKVHARTSRLLNSIALPYLIR